MRKSREKRITDTETTISLYEAAGLGDDKSVRFMKDMIYRLQRGKGLSKRQRAWIDKLHEDGVPVSKGDSKLISQIDSAIQILVTDARAVEVLNSFKGKLHRGWSFSEKQTAFLNTLLHKAEDIKKNGHYRPSPDTVKDLHIACNVIRARAEWTAGNKPGTFKAYEKVNTWLVAEELVEKSCKDLNNFVIDEWCVEKVLGAGKVAIREIKNPKHPPGSMRYLLNQPVLVSNGPIFSGSQFRGHPLYEVLVNGQVKCVEGSRLLKRSRKK